MGGGHAKSLLHTSHAAKEEAKAKNLVVMHVRRRDGEDYGNSYLALTKRMLDRMEPMTDAV